MLLQTNSYIVPKEKRAEHARLMLRFRQVFRRFGSVFEVYEQTGPNFTGDSGGRFVQIMRFRDRHHQQEVREKEQKDPAAQQLIADFCQLVNLNYQQQHGLYSASYYAGILRDRPSDKPELLVTEGEDTLALADELAPEAALDAPGEPAESVEEAFGPFLREPQEYDVQQQIEPQEPPPDEPEPAGRETRSAGSRPAPR